MVEMCGRVYYKKTSCWLWHDMNHDTGELIVYVFGTRGREVLQKLLTLLSKLNVEIVTMFFFFFFAYFDVIFLFFFLSGY
jgi:IS1 family transposase